MRRALTVAFVAGVPAFAYAEPISPGQGALTVGGNTWTITASGSIRENGSYTPGGGGTQALTVVGGTVYGEDAHGRGWFTLSGNGGYWTSSAPPAGASAASPGHSIASAPVATSPAAPVHATTQVGLAASYSCGTSVPNSAASHGGFGTISGQILQPDGTPFIARGVNVREDVLNANPGQVPATFPGVNFVRVPVYSFTDPAAFTAAVQTLTSQGIVVEFEDHITSTGSSAGGGVGDVFTGSLLSKEQSWYGAMAQTYASNPYVWFGTNNEPPTNNLPGLSNWQRQTYETIRAAGNTSPVMLELPGGGDPGLTGAGSGLNVSDYANMENVVWDAHYYGWVSQYSTDQGAVNQALASEVSSAQSIQGLDGKIPVIIGEYGNSTTGASIDPNGTQVVSAVTSSGLGSAAWAFDDGNPGDGLLSGGGLSSYGQQVAQFIQGSGATGCNISPVASLVPTSQTVTGSLVPQNSLSIIPTPAGM